VVERAVACYLFQYVKELSLKGMVTIKGITFGKQITPLQRKLPLFAIAKVRKRAPKHKYILYIVALITMRKCGQRALKASLTDLSANAGFNMDYDKKYQRAGFGANLMAIPV
jgi:hypothetical protein